MIRTKPTSPVNFDVHEEGIIKLFNEFDRYHARVHRDKNATPDEAAVLRVAEVEPGTDSFQANFQLVSALAQMPHLDPVAEMQKRAGRPLAEPELRALRRRIQSACTWVERFAAEEEKTRLQPTLPARSAELNAAQRGFLRRLSETLQTATWEDDALQAAVFETARTTPIAQPPAFKAIYRVLLDKESGPKAGNLLAFLERDFVCKRFAEVAVETADFWRETAVSSEQLAQWMNQNRDQIATYRHDLRSDTCGNVLELTVEMKDGKRHVHRTWLEPTPDVSAVLAQFA
jgi:lysyl-tRNA synthetase class 1